MKGNKEERTWCCWELSFEEIVRAAEAEDIDASSLTEEETNQIVKKFKDFIGNAFWNWDIALIEIVKEVIVENNQKENVKIVKDSVRKRKNKTVKDILNVDIEED